MFLRIRGRRRYLDEQLERYHHRSRACKRSPESFAELIFKVNLIQTVHENRIYSLKIICGPSYPDVRPDVQFVSRVNLPFVNQMNGLVDYNKLPVLSTWSRQSSIETVLVDIRKSVIRFHHTILN